jgi:hypothetical protein
MKKESLWEGGVWETGISTLFENGVPFQQFTQYYQNLYPRGSISELIVNSAIERGYKILTIDTEAKIEDDHEVLSYSEYLNKNNLK